MSEVTQPFAELHSDEVQDIINRPPQWIVRWGITVLFTLMIVFLVCCWLVKYPDIVRASFVLTSTDAPRIVKTRLEGKLVRLLATDGRNVSQGQILAYLESTADHEQVLRLDRTLNEFEKVLSHDQWTKVGQFELGGFDNLGEIQKDFQTFDQELKQLKTFLEGGYYLQKRRLLTGDLEDLKALEKNLADQLELQKHDLQIAEDELTIQEKLLRAKAIAPLEYQREKAKVITRSMPLKVLMSSLIQSRLNQKDKEKEILELDNAIQEHKGAFSESLHALLNNINSWKQRFLITAPVDGRISYSEPWHEQQYLNGGQEFAGIEPVSNTHQGLIKIPQSNLGKVQIGQVVHVKLAGYPYREFGLMEGRLTKQSMIPGPDSLYWGYVSLPKRLKTSFGREIPYRNGLSGTAEIVTSERRLIERLLALFLIN